MTYNTVGNEIHENIEEMKEIRDTNDCYHNDDKKFDEENNMKGSINENTPLVKRKMTPYIQPIIQRYNKCHIFLSINVLLLSIPIPIVGFCYCLICWSFIVSKTLKEMRRIILLISIASSILYVLIILILILVVLLDDTLLDKILDNFREG